MGLLKVRFCIKPSGAGVCEHWAIAIAHYIWKGDDARQEYTTTYYKAM
jgi:hypothetical protein